MEKPKNGQTGWIRMSKASMPTLKDPDALRVKMIVSCLRDDGVPIAQKAAREAFLSSAFKPVEPTSEAPEALQDLEKRLLSESFERVKRENFEWLLEEEQRLDRYAQDIEIEADAQIRALEAELGKLQKAKRSPDISIEEKTSIARKVREMWDDLEGLNISKFEGRQEAQDEFLDKLDDYADVLNAKPRLVHLFTTRWRIA